MKLISSCRAALLLLAGPSICAQQTAHNATQLAQLIAEAERNNPQISAADHNWRAATHVAQQVMTLPDPQFTVQQFSVGSPKPFAGFTNSNFAYIGFGASQDLPYPGKLRLKGQVAEREARTQQVQADSVRVSIAEQVKADYFQLAYLQQTLVLLQRSQATLKQLAGSQLSRYKVGEGSQAEVLKAQLQHTEMLREITIHHARMLQYQADLKWLVHRAQTSPDIVPEPLTPTSLRYSAAELLAFVSGHNPDVRVKSSELTMQEARLQSARREGKPDFSIGYMFQRTGNPYPAYYMLTFNLRLPRRKRVRAEMAEAAENVSRGKAQLDAQIQQQLADVQKQYIAVTSAAELLTEYRDGLIPQAQAAYSAGLTSYESNRGELTSVLSSFNDELQLERDYLQALLDHETAIAHLEALTGATLQ
jgi:cobalt-zinc-cadmium efflux system outer membrane protein